MSPRDATSAFFNENQSSNGSFEGTVHVCSAKGTTEENFHREKERSDTRLKQQNGFHGIIQRVERNIYRHEDCDAIASRTIGSICFRVARTFPWSYNVKHHFWFTGSWTDNLKVKLRFGCVDSVSTCIICKALRQLINGRKSVGFHQNNRNVFTITNLFSLRVTGQGINGNVSFDLVPFQQHSEQNNDRVTSGIGEIFENFEHPFELDEFLKLNPIQSNTNHP